MRKIKKNINLLFLALIILMSCNEEGLNLNNNQVNTDDFSLASAEKYAVEIFSPDQSNNDNAIKSRLQPKKVANSKSIKSKEGEATMHLINYEDDRGFIIMSAKKNVFPILAYNDKGNFNLSNTEELPEGLKLWMEETEKNVLHSSRINAKSKAFLKNAWEVIDKGEPVIENEAIGTNAFDEPDPNDCDIIYRERGPLLATAWGQGCEFNQFCPARSNGPCGRAVAGCIPVAIAQVVRFWEFPNNYNYAGMGNLNGDINNARLIADAGIFANANYGASATWAYPWNIPDVFMDDFNYSGNVQRIDYPDYQVNQNLFNNQPVLLEGRKNATSDWHVWVGDGIKYYQNYCDGYGYTYLHMNWGWNSQNLNGWYTSWKPNGNDFSKYKKAIVNIVP